jgi:hypothetical protein
MSRACIQGGGPKRQRRQSRNPPCIARTFCANRFLERSASIDTNSKHRTPITQVTVHENEILVDRPRIRHAIEGFRICKIAKARIQDRERKVSLEILFWDRQI